VADYYERLVHQLGLSVGGVHKMNTVKAPMPGLVLNIVVEPGQTVEKGDPMIILEAMKMENVIKAAGEGRVKAIKVQKGMAVDKGQLLIELD
jgi:biotin carboxyl carrier protein